MSFKQIFHQSYTPPGGKSGAKPSCVVVEGIELTSRVTLEMYMLTLSFNVSSFVRGG